MRSRRAVAEINVVPYIDVMLVLLVIFMATAPLLMQGVEVDLPKADSSPVSDSDAEPLIVSLSLIFSNILSLHSRNPVYICVNSSWFEVIYYPFYNLLFNNILIHFGSI